MPTYEYHCEKCDQDFSKQMRMAEHDKADVECPKCHEHEASQRYSVFYAKTSKKS